MRNNKYRAWNTEEEIMVYKNEDNSSSYWDGVILSDIDMVNARMNNSYRYIWMQYLGREDSEDNSIYEGDIIESKCGTWSGYIVYDTNQMAYIVRFYSSRTPSRVGELDLLHKWVVVGHIFEEGRGGHLL